MESEVPAIRPTKPTLARYGLTLAEWERLFTDQGSVCACCRKPSRSGRYCVDHEHVKGWAKMDPAHRRWFVRGIVCNNCNHRLLGRFMTLAGARAIIAYLEAYDYRKGLA